MPVRASRRPTKPSTFAGQGSATSRTISGCWWSGRTGLPAVAAGGGDCGRLVGAARHDLLGWACPAAGVATRGRCSPAAVASNTAPSKDLRLLSRETLDSDLHTVLTHESDHEGVLPGLPG